jgi:hypothetical protein
VIYERLLVAVLLSGYALTGDSEPIEGGTDAMVLVPRSALVEMLGKNRELFDAAQEADDEIERLQKSIDLLKIKQGCA